MDYLDKLVSRSNDLLAEVRASLDAAAEADIDLTDEESEKIKASHAEIRSLDEQIADLEDIAKRDAIAVEERTAPQESAVRPIVVKSEARTYNAGGENSFLTDAFAARNGSPQASERIARHQSEEAIERRDIGTSAFAGLVVPQYLTSQFAELARAGRPFANAIDSQPLPAEGMTLNISRGTTGTATAVQETQNTGAQETNFDDTLLTVDVRTIAGQQDLSRQLLERGTSSIDSIIFADLVSSYHTELNRGILNDAGTSGTHLGVIPTSGINSVTYTDESPTVAEIVPKLADAIQKVNSNRYLPADLIVMHPVRWGWFTAGVDTTKRPLVVPNAYAPTNASGANDRNAYGQVVGSLLGLPVITDASLPTTWSSGASNTSGTEDVVLVVRSSDIHLWETPNTPLQLRFEETTAGSLTVKLLVYGYSAFTAGRYPQAVARIVGTGLAAPTF